MKLVMDEKVKHRLVGLAVIISLGAIFAPALIKKSNQGPESDFSVNVKLPPKPLVPDVAVTDEKEVFKTIKVARAEIPSDIPEDKLPRLANAEPISIAPEGASRTKSLAEANVVNNNKFNVNATTIALNKAANTKAKQVVTLASNKSLKPKAVVAKLDKSKQKAKPVGRGTQVAVRKAVKPVIKNSTKKGVYALQLASFSQVSNAQSLVNKLQSGGFRANYIKTTSRTGPMYKVYVGHSPDKNQVLKLKTQLAQAMQLTGFIVNTGVS